MRKFLRHKGQDLAVETIGGLCVAGLTALAVYLATVTAQSTGVRFYIALGTTVFFGVAAILSLVYLIRSGALEEPEQTSPESPPILQPPPLPTHSKLSVDVLPGIRFDLENPSDMTKWILCAEVKAIGGDAHIRDAFLETSDRVTLRPGRVAQGSKGWNPDGQLIHTLQKDETLTIYFAQHTEEGGGRLVPPDYYHAPWGHVSTATRVIVRTLDGDYPSIANASIRELADAVARFRNSGGRVNNLSVTFKTPGGIGRAQR